MDPAKEIKSEIKSEIKKVIIKTFDGYPFTLLSTHPLLKGAGFNCIDFDKDTIPIHSDDFANIVYYLSYDDYEGVYNLLKLILQYSIIEIENHFIEILKRKFTYDFLNYVKDNNMDLHLFLESSDSLEEFNGKIMYKYNRDFERNKLKIYDILQRKEFSLLYNYDTFRAHFFVMARCLGVLSEIFSDNSLSKHIIENLVNFDLPNETLESIVKYSNVEILKYLIEKGLPIETIISYNKTLIYYACELKKYDMVKYLVEKGANMEGTKDSASLIHLVVNDFEMLKYFINKGANIHSLDFFGRTILVSACKYSNFETIKYLIEKGVNVFRGPLLRYAREYQDPLVADYIKNCMYEFSPGYKERCLRNIANKKCK